MDHASGRLHGKEIPVTSAKLSRGTAFYLLASISTTLLFGSSAPTPLYSHYQAQWGFAPVTTTLIFGVYAIAVLSALLVGGRLSDHVGRRPVLMASMVVSAAAMVMFATAAGRWDLFLARLIQGLATGMAVATVGAGLLDLDKKRGAVANALAPISGTALGGLMAGLMVHFLPYPTHLVYLALGVVFLLQAGAVAFMEEPVLPRSGALASLRPRFSVPPQLRTPVLVAMPVLVAAWALAGFYASLGPALIRKVFGFDPSLYGGVALFVMVGSGAVAVLLLMQQGARMTMLIGASGLFLGTAGVLYALHIQSSADFFLASALAGGGFGAGFQGAIRSVVPIAAPHHRAGLLSVVFVVSYLAMGVPAIAAGFALSDGAAILAVSQWFGSFVLALSGLAWLATSLTKVR